MSSSTIKIQRVKAQNVKVSNDSITVDLTDGRSVSVPIGWYPRLLHGSPDERENWRLIGQGEGIHWSELDEDISVESIIVGKSSGERQHSLKCWLDERSLNNYE